jgi:hypothetical protein
VIAHYPFKNMPCTQKDRGAAPKVKINFDFVLLIELRFLTSKGEKLIFTNFIRRVILNHPALV